MKQRILSDHGAEQARAAADRRQAEFEAAQARHSRQQARRRARAETLRAAAGAARRQRRPLQWLRSQLQRLRFWLRPGPTAPRKPPARRDEIVWRAGREGERQVIETLARALDDRWTLIGGYRNPAGEIDGILVGPDGLLAFEIKSLNGVVHCEGDRWWRDKHDRRGKRVRTGVPVVDRGGRGPSAQVNEATDRLEHFLASRGGPARIARAVVLAHPRSGIGTLKNQTVDLVTTLSHFTPATIDRVMTGRPDTMTTTRLVALIERDHAFHAGRRKGPPPRARRRR